MNKNAIRQFKAYGTLERNQKIVRLNLNDVSMTDLAWIYRLSIQRISAICHNPNNFEDIIQNISEKHHNRFLVACKGFIDKMCQAIEEVVNLDQR